MKVKTITFENRILIYWGYEYYQHNLEYDFYLNGVKIGSSTKTHFLFKNLTPNSKYNIVIKNNKEVFDSLSVQTLKERERIYIDFKSNEPITNLIQNILDSASGKTIVFKPGKYISGALFVKPNTHIELLKGASLIGTSNSKDYLPLIPSRFEGLTMKCFASLINIGKCDSNKNYEDANVYIYGDGEIIGGGKQLCENIISDMLPSVSMDGLDPKRTNPNVLAGRYRGRLIQVNNCNNIVIEGLKLGYSPSWNLHFIYSKNIVVANCTIESKDLHNGDGVDPDSCENVDIFNVVFNTGDDCVAIKSGKNPDGNKINRPTKNISVFDCKSIIGHGCCVGSEMSGGIDGVYMFDCDFINTRYGIQIKTTKKRGGYVKNVFVKDMKLASLNIRTVSYNDEGVGCSDLPHFEHFRFENIELAGIDVGNFGNEKIETNHIEIKGFLEDKKAFNDIVINKVNYRSNNPRVVVENASNIKIGGSYE